MFDEQNSGEIFVIPQRGAGRHFSEVTSRNKIDQISLETANGRPIADLPLRINVRNIVPKVFRLPMQAFVIAISVLAKIFGFRVIFLLREDAKRK